MDTLRALVATWRERAERLSSDSQKANADMIAVYVQCAAALDAALYSQSDVRERLMSENTPASIGDWDLPQAAWEHIARLRAIAAAALQAADAPEGPPDALEAMQKERDEYKTLASIGTWHKDCRPNRHQAVETIQKQQAVIDKLADTISELRAAPEGPQGWQPIATAPKDGTWFLAWDYDGGCYSYRDGPGFIPSEYPEPTHWQPLPAPPRPEATPQEPK